MSPDVPEPAPVPADLAEALVHASSRHREHVYLHVLVDLRRPPERDALAEAIRATCADFPVLDCRFETRWWRDRWVPLGTDPAEVLHVEDVGVDPVRATERWVQGCPYPLDIRPWRVALLRHDDGARLIVSVHHMVVDGGGAMAVTHRLAAHLAGVEPLAPVARSRLLSQLWRHLRLRDAPTLLAELAREGLQPMSILRVQPLPYGDAGDAAPSPAWRTLVLDRDDSHAFTARCRDAGATLNDGLVAAMTRLHAARTPRGPVCAAYTIDLRRYLPRRRLLAGNLHGVQLVVLPRSRVGSPGDALRAVTESIGEQKRRLFGLAYALLPSLTLGLWPDALRRRLGSLLLSRILAYLGRVLAVTNIGALDEYLAPLGDEVVDASMLGPFLTGVPFPVVIATGYRGRLTLHVCACDGAAAEALGPMADDLRAELIEDSGGDRSRRG